ncbi:MAG: protein translocase subunit SecF [Ruminococcaceae bacterium]|nr:protein translocase subunit SecF [Oscillospiraceae bacterium]
MLNINIVKNKWMFFVLPLVIIVAAIVTGIFAGGFALDIDFAGGTEMVIDFGKTVPKADIENLFSETLGFKASAVQQSLANENQYTIKSQNLTKEQIESVWNAYKTKYELKDEQRLAVDSVSPTIGKELTQSAVVACAIAVVLMLLYITVRFEFLSGVSAIVALAHDVLILLSGYMILRMPLNTSFIAAILTIIGYSINDTIVVFDRIRENVKFAKRGETYGDIANKSVMQTITRSINTSVTTLITIVLLYFLGVDAIKDFALALIIGLVAGTYSSIFIAAPLWIAMKKDKKQGK